MSIFIPYTPEMVLTYFTNLFSLDLTILSDYEILYITLFANLYFFVFWFFIIYFALVLFNKFYERLF